MASIGLALLLYFVQLYPLVASSIHADGNLTHRSTLSLCRPDQADALLKLKQSFMFHHYDKLDTPDSITTLPSWQAGTDCCLWEGVGCSTSTGHVTALNLSGFGLYSYGIDPVLFNLTSLRLLDLSMNDFGDQRYEIPSVGFERLALLTHLNLSNSGISGQVPVGISKLMNLVSLDLSNRPYLSTDLLPYASTFSGTPNKLWETNFQTLVANLSNLRELYLDLVSISPSTAEDCFKALAYSVPHLRVLSLEGCSLEGHLGFGNMTSLERLDISDCQLSGPIPQEVGAINKLTSLGLANTGLSGRIPSSIGNLTQLTDLWLNSNSLIGKFSSLIKLYWPNFYGNSYQKV